MKKVIEDLNIAKNILIFPQMLSDEVRIRIGQTISTAIDLLKEQEPMPMIEVEDDDLYAWSPEDIDYYCPKCEKEISYDYHFCPYCGQAVKLNEID